MTVKFVTNNFFHSLSFHLFIAQYTILLLRFLLYSYRVWFFSIKSVAIIKSTQQKNLSYRTHYLIVYDNHVKHWIAFGVLSVCVGTIFEEKIIDFSVAEHCCKRQWVFTIVSIF